MDSWTQEHGLPVKWVLDVARTPDGYLWIATYFDSLVRFDGVRFVPLTELFEGVADHAVAEELHVESDGALIVVQARRILRIRGTKMEVVLSHDVPFSGAAPADAPGAFFALRRDHVEHISAEGSSLPKLPDGSVLSDAIAAARGRDGAMLYARQGELIRVKGKQVERVELLGSSCPGGALRIRELSSGALALILGAEGVCIVRDLSASRFGPAQGVAGAVNDVHEDRAGRVWLLTTRGLQRIVGDKVQPEAPQLPFEVTSALEDDEGSFWVGSPEGLFRFRPAVFTAFSGTLGNTRSSPTSVLVAGSGAILFGTFDGALREWKDGVISERVPPVGRSGEFVQSLSEQPNGSVVMGVLNRGLYRVSGSGVEPMMDEGEFRKHKFRDQLPGPNGRYWLAGRVGLFELADGKPRQIDEVLGLRRPVYIRKEARGDVWGTDADGLFHIVDHRPVRVRGSREKVTLYSVQRDRKDRVWIATGDRGLLLVKHEVLVGGLDMATGGLPANALHAAVPDGHGTLWLTSNRGAVLLDEDEAESAIVGRRRATLRVLSVGDGLPTAEFNGGYPPAEFDPQGRFWAVTPTSLVRADPRQLGSNRLPPPVHIEGFRVDRTRVRLEGVPELAPGGQQYAIDYTALSLLVPSRVRFRYRLEGYDDDWVDAGDRRTAYYTGLSPGLHRFRVKACNNDGVWNEEGASLVFRVRPAFHQTWMFLLLCAAGAAAALFGVYRLRVRQLTARQAHLEETVAERTRELASEKERSERLLLNVLPAPIAERLKNSEALIADQFDEVTILFADLVGFTELSSRLTPAQLVEILNDVFSAFDALVVVHGVEKIKTIGDAYMAVAGVPSHRPDHAEATVQLALEMGVKLAEVNQRRGLSLSIRTGINTGRVVAGVIGRRKFSYDLWGDAVNVASRMESHGAPGRIHISESTYQRVKDRFRLEPRGTITVKGKGALETWFVIG